MAFRIKIQEEALLDIQEGIKWYNEQQKGSGRRLFAEIKVAFKILKVNPFFQIL